jgi:hypothetical protein
MKNPMDRQMEKRLSDRAVAIGREGQVMAFGELLELRLFGYAVGVDERSEVSRIEDGRSGGGHAD